jgi:hypothetical protein
LICTSGHGDCTAGHWYSPQLIGVLGVDCPLTAIPTIINIAPARNCLVILLLVIIIRKFIICKNTFFYPHRRKKTKNAAFEDAYLSFFNNEVVLFAALI